MIEYIKVWLFIMSAVASGVLLGGCIFLQAIMKVVDKAMSCDD